VSNLLDEILDHLDELMTGRNHTLTGGQPPSND